MANKLWCPSKNGYLICFMDTQILVMCGYTETRFIPQWEKDKERGCPNFGDYLLRDKRCLT